MDTNRIPKKALQYKPKGRRNIGRPRKRWRDQLHLEDQGTGNTPNPSGTWWWWWWWWWQNIHTISKEENGAGSYAEQRSPHLMDCSILLVTKHIKIDVVLNYCVWWSSLWDCATLLLLYILTVYSTLYTMGIGSFPRLKYGRGMLLTTHPLLVPRSWKSRTIPLPTLYPSGKAHKGMNSCSLNLAGLNKCFYC